MNGTQMTLIEQVLADLCKSSACRKRQISLIHVLFRFTSKFFNPDLSIGKYI